MARAAQGARWGDRRGHRLLSELSGAPGELVEARVGYVYMANSMLWQSSDPAPSRPVVVLAVPAATRREIGVVARTSDISRDGVLHTPDPVLGLDRRGVWADMRYIDKDRWRDGHVRQLGPLDAAVFAEIQGRFG